MKRWLASIHRTIDVTSKDSEMHKIFLTCIFIVLAGCDLDATRSGSSAVIYSDIRPDEYVVFFRTAAWLDKVNQEWHVPIHGWVYEYDDSAARKALFSAILKNEYDLAPDDLTRANFTRRFNLIIADNERGKRIVVDIAGRTYAMPASAENGQFETTLIIPAADIDRNAVGNVIRYSAVTAESEVRAFAGETLLLDSNGLSIISDIDDTVKISNVNDRRSLLENTFLLDFSAVPGMSKLYNEWSAKGASLHFVSSSPWQLYSPLQEFLDENQFAWSTLSLKSIRFRDETLLNLFKKGTETKPAAIEKILDAYSDRKFVLVGDSGEHDPEVYAALMRKFPKQILMVYIRNVTQESEDSERFSTVFENIRKSRWQLFDDPTAVTGLALPE